MYCPIDLYQFNAFLFVAKKLNVYDVLAPYVYSPLEGFVPVLRKNVKSKVHEVCIYNTILTTPSVNWRRALLVLGLRSRSWKRSLVVLRLSEGGALWFSGWQEVEYFGLLMEGSGALCFFWMAEKEASWSLQGRRWALVVLRLEGGEVVFLEWQKMLLSTFLDGRSMGLWASTWHEEDLLGIKMAGFWMAGEGGAC